jgi:hypothetical protein
MHKLAFSFAVAAVAAAGPFAVLPAFAQDVPLDKQKGVRGRVVVAPELLSTPVPIEGERDRLLRSPAIVRRPMGRKPQPILEAPPALTVMLEGDGLPKAEGAALPKLVFQGMRFSPGSLVVPRPSRVQVENKHQKPITLSVGGKAGPAIAPGEVGEIELPAGEHLLTVSELAFAAANVRVLDKGRALPVKDGEIPLVDIPGGSYQLAFFLGAEPLRIQPITVPERELVFIDATVSALKVVEVSIKDASMRVAIPPTLREQPETP